MSEQQAEKLEFTAEGVAEAFGGDSLMGGMLAESEATPEDFAAYLNDQFDQSDCRSLSAMFVDHSVELDIGGEAKLRENTSFDEWKRRTGYGDDS